MDWKGYLCVMMLSSLCLFMEVDSQGTFIPSSLSMSVMRLCNSLKDRTRCPPGTCQTINTTPCTRNSDCPCEPTNMEICCPTTAGTGCCVSVPLPLAIIGITG